MNLVCFLLSCPRRRMASLIPASTAVTHGNMRVDQCKRMSWYRRNRSLRWKVDFLFNRALPKSLYGEPWLWQWYTLNRIFKGGLQKERGSVLAPLTGIKRIRVSFSQQDNEILTKSCCNEETSLGSHVPESSLALHIVPILPNPVNRFLCVAWHQSWEVSVSLMALTCNNLTF